MASSTRNQGSVRAPFVNINQLTRSGASDGDVPVFNSPRWGVGEGGGNATRTIRPYIAFNSAPITDAFWAMAPAGTLIWILVSNDAPRGFYRADGTDTLVRATEYDSDYLDTDVYLPGLLVSTLAGFTSNDPSNDSDTLIGQNLHWHFRDWNATRATMGASVGVLDTSVFVNYEPTNYTTESEDGATNLGDHLAGIDNAIGFLIASTSP